ncbi:transposase-like protein [Paenibacillus sp. PastM-2]|nr:transposase-like protein [Paenibacillus sp. PastM-2]
MGLWSKQQLREFIKENNLVTAQDAQNALKDLFAETIQEMLEAEMDTHLGYGKHEVKAKLTPNSRNGKSRKTVVVSTASRKSPSLGTGWVSLSPWSLRSINPM